MDKLTKKTITVLAVYSVLVFSAVAVAQGDMNSTSAEVNTGPIIIRIGLRSHIYRIGGSGEFWC